MKILYLNPDAEQREFEQIGEAASYEQLQQFFDAFDWESGNKTIARRKELDLPFFPQILRFQKSEDDFLDIQPAGKDEFFVSCVNGKLVFEEVILGDVTRSNFSIDEFLGDFWDGNLIDKYDFEELNHPGSAGSIVDSKSEFSFLKLWPLALAVFLSVLTLDKKSKPASLVNILISLVPLVFALPYTILLWQYFKHNKNSTLSVSKKNKTLTMVRQGTPRTIRLRDITKSKIVLNKNGRLLTYGWGYLLLELGPKDRIVITSFLYEELEELAELLGLKPVVFDSIYPLIRLRIKSDAQLIEEKNEHEAKVQEFVEKWSGKSKEELLAMKKNPSAYAKYALEAMNILLKKK